MRNYSVNDIFTDSVYESAESRPLFTRVREINIKLADTGGKIAAGSFSTNVRQKRGKSRVRGGPVVGHGGGPKEKAEGSGRAGPTLPDGAQPATLPAECLP